MNAEAPALGLVTISARLCERAGMCAELAGHLFRLPDSDGPAEVVLNPVPAEFNDVISDAILMCPTGAIKLAGSATIGPKLSD